MPIKYDYKRIGERIRKERKELGINQVELGQKLNEYYSPRTVGKWERGEELPPLKVLLNLCELFNCETGYILCEIDCKTRNAADISKETGLSEEAISVLKNEVEWIAKINNEVERFAKIHNARICGDVKTTILQDFVNILIENNSEVMGYIKNFLRTKEKYEKLKENVLFPEMNAIYEKVSREDDSMSFETSQNAKKFYDELEKLLKDRLPTYETNARNSLETLEIRFPNDESREEFIKMCCDECVDISPFSDAYKIISDYRNSKYSEYAISSSLMDLVKRITD